MLTLGDASRGDGSDSGDDCKGAILDSVVHEGCVAAAHCLAEAIDNQEVGYSEEGLGAAVKPVDVGERNSKSRLRPSESATCLSQVGR